MLAVVEERTRRNHTRARTPWCSRTEKRRCFALRARLDAWPAPLGMSVDGDYSGLAWRRRLRPRSPRYLETCISVTRDARPQVFRTRGRTVRKPLARVDLPYVAYRRTHERAFLRRIRGCLWQFSATRVASRRGSKGTVLRQVEMRSSEKPKEMRAAVVRA